jgi:hypothetical protein
MKQYLLSIEQPAGPPPSTMDMGRLSRDVAALEAELQAAGVWIFNGHLHEPSTATVVQLNNGDIRTTDGPYFDGDEHLGGICIIEAADLDAALAWGGKLARATTLPVEVRPFQGETAD